MSPAESPLERALANRLVAISVSDSPDLGRLGMLERNLKQTVSALATGLVRHGARIAYGGNLDRSGFTYQLYPAVAQAYATAALRSARPPFVHYVAAYLAQDAADVATHLKEVARFAEICLVDRDRVVTSFVAHGNDLVSRSGPAAPAMPSSRGGHDRRLTDLNQLSSFVAELPRGSAGQAADLNVMREVMEDAVSARIVIGGRVAGYAGDRPGVLQEVLLALRKGHPLIPLGGFGGAARDTAIALGLMSRDDALSRQKVGPGYPETVEEIATCAEQYRKRADAAGAWDDLVAASKAEDAEAASTHVMRALIHFANGVHKRLPNT
jgi:hypothetical protein